MKKKVFWFFLAILLLFAVAVAGAGWVFMKKIVSGVPSVAFLKSFVPVTTSRIYDRNGKHIGSFYRERREYLPLKSIPPLVIRAVLAVEDAHFYEHGALAYGSIIRAAVSDVLAGYLREGASTITQQLARNIFLNHKKNLTRKLREAILSYRIESVLTKDEILELYLNQIYFGEGAYGVQAASQAFFGKDIHALTLPEAALMAGLIRSPVEFSPYAHPGASKRRQLVALERMEKVGYITHEEMKKAYGQPLVFRQRIQSKNPNAYFLEYLRRRLEMTMSSTQLYGGGLRIFTSLDSRIQSIALHSLRNGLRTIDRRKGFRGAIRHLSPQDFREVERETVPLSIAEKGAFTLGGREEVTITHVGEKGAFFSWEGHPGFIPKAKMLWAAKVLRGPDFDHDVKVLSPFSPVDILKPGDVVMAHLTGWTPVRKGWVFLASLDQVPLIQGCVVAIDPRTGGILAMVGGYSFGRSKFNRVSQAIRQPGSSFKMVDYGSALEHGYTPSSILHDEPVVFADRAHHRVWRPKDYEHDFLGPVPMRKALAESINLATIRMVRRVGVGNVISFGRRLGITSPLSHDLSLALGSSGVRPIELTSAYSVIANGGIREPVYSIRRVVNFRKTTVFEHIPAPTKVYNPAYDYMLTSMLQSVISEGTGKDALVLPRLLAGKTGTTNDFKDAWFIGFSPDIAVGVYVGMDDHRSMGRGEFGAHAALPIWIDIMKGALPLLPNTPFSVPDDIVNVRIDPDTGRRSPENSTHFVTEIFRKGELPPRESASGKQPDAQFYNLQGAP